jgi:hypothetical protein
MPAPKLTVNQPGKEPRDVEIAGIISIGRMEDNTVSLIGDTNVSKYHAVIEPRGGEFWISDLGSSNGTLINDELINAARRLRDGDTISVGGTSTLIVHLPAPAKPVAKPAPPPVMPPPPDASAAAIAMPQTPAPQVALPPTPTLPTPPPAAAKILGMPRLLVASVAAGIVTLTASVAILFSTGIIGGSNAKAPRAAAAAQTAVVDTLADESSDDPLAASADSPASDEAPNPASESAPPVTAAPVAPVVAAPIAASADATTNMARTLAVQISQKSLYNFDPNFVLLINKHVGEYRAARGYTERARSYRENIDREFVNGQGIQPPLIAYVTAMSRTKFIAGETGAWALPLEVAREYATDATAADLADPAKSTRLAAAYMKSLLDLFERDNFMYAVACYGMTLDEAGKVRTALESKDPGGQARYDFWKMKNAGVVSGEQVERVARFFAAGIVTENPQAFNTGERQLSSLY